MFYLKGFWQAYSRILTAVLVTNSAYVGIYLKKACIHFRFESPPHQSIQFHDNEEDVQLQDLNEMGNGTYQENNPDWLNSSNGMNNMTNNQGIPPIGNGQMTHMARGSSGGKPKPARRRFADDDEKYASIDHAARAERLKQQNYLKFRAKYGDSDMRYVSAKTFADCITC